MLDIHAHILPGVDDGAADVSASLKLLRMMKTQGITEVIATPHFYAMEQSIEDFEDQVAHAYSQLAAAAAGGELPRVSLGSEVFYFRGIGRSRGIRALTLCRSQYILLELPNCRLDSDILQDVIDLNDRLGLVPILAHLERYAAERGFRDLLRLIDHETVFAQVNASSLLHPRLKRPAMKLIKRGIASFLATDTHSPDGRPPMMEQALKLIGETCGERTARAFVRHSENLRDEIFVCPGSQGGKYD